MDNSSNSTPNTPQPNPLAKTDHWQAPLTGHGLAYFRELAVDYTTLQWINPFAAAAVVAQDEADEKKNAAAAVEAAFKDTPDSAQKTALEDARKKAAEASEKAVELAAKKDMADKAKEEARKVIDLLIEKFKQNNAVWSDLLEFESAFLRLLTGEKLRARYESMTAEYKGLTGVAVPDAPKEEDALRARAETLLADIHWAYTTGPVQEEQRSRMVLALACVTLLVFLVGLIFARWSGCLILPWVAMAGAAGAALSAFQRVQSRDVKGDALTNCQKANDDQNWLTNLWSRVCGQGSFALAPVVGALSAIVLAHIFAAGLITSPVLPAVPPSGLPTNSVPKAAVTNQSAATTNAPIPTNTPPSTNAFATTNKPAVAASTNAMARNELGIATAQTNGGGSSNALPIPQITPPESSADDSEHPKGKRNCIGFLCHCWRFITCKDLALLLVWSFIAGFFERLVPDIISRLSERAKEKS